MTASYSHASGLQGSENCGHFQDDGSFVTAAELPPPYFPTTGRYKRNLYYQIDPRTFDVEAFFASTS